MSGSTLIVGAGQAGVQLAASLRELDPAAPVTLAGAEEHQPYQRPPLSKAFLTGKADLGSLALRNPAFYAEQRIGLLTGDRITALDLAPDGSGSALTAGGRTLEFDRLALTTGAGPRPLPVPGADLEGVCRLRDADDAARLRRLLGSASSVVVVGGGFIGLEAAAVARGLGLEVTVVEALDRLMARAVSPAMSDFYLDAHRRRGTRVLLGTAVTALGGRDGRVTSVELSNGVSVPADVVVVGIGVVPRTELAERLGLRCEGGIVVDERARTSHPGVVAAGDCTVLPHPDGTGLIRLESVQNAVDQAKTAAATLCGKEPQHPPVPWFWSDQAELKLQIAGLSAGHDLRVVRGDPASGRFTVLCYRDGRLAAVEAVNRPADYMAGRRALAQAATIPAEKAADPEIPLKELITPLTHASTTGA